MNTPRPSPPPSTHPSLVVALDVPDKTAALQVAENFSGLPVWMKVGLELVTACGPSVVHDLTKAGFPVFLDMKFHDIPNTVAGAVRSATFAGASMLTIHVSGGKEMAQAAVKAKEEAWDKIKWTAPLSSSENFDISKRKMPILLGITVLTSTAFSDGPKGAQKLHDLVLERALQAQDSGLDGIVCSGQEARAVKQACGPDFICLCPGIRFAGGSTDDQARVCTPAEAVNNGADFLVMGRPLLRAASPKEAALQALQEIKTGMRLP